MRLIRWPPYRRPTADEVEAVERVRAVDSTAEVLLRQRVRIGLPLVVVWAWLARPTPEAFAIGTGVAMLGLLVRGAAASHLTKHTGLATEGPYALTRNPLYVGTALLVSGLLIAAHSWLAGLLGAAYFLIFYPPAIRREERSLRARYGRAFDEYAARVPRFWPRLRTAASTQFRWSWRLYGRNREYTAAVGVLLGLVFLWLQMRRGS